MKDIQKWGFKGWRCNSMIDHLPSSKTLGLIFSTAKNRDLIFGFLSPTKE
jgi:hypothetical protein